MPIYEFKCPQCNDTVEQFFTIYADPKINCGHCAVPMMKQFAATPAIFKGDGWVGKTK
jgi:putative FmdB family regulatory protein